MSRVCLSRRVPAAVLAATMTVAIVGGAGCRRSADGTAAEAPQAEHATLQRTTAVLQRQLDLAVGTDFYLVYDPAGADLTLMLRGAELQRYHVLGAQVGRPRVGWFKRRGDDNWQHHVWKDGTLEPPRQMDRFVLEGGDAAKPGAEVKAPPIPPTAEELYPVPARYLIRFADGLSLEVRPREAAQNRGGGERLRAWASTRWRDFVAALRDGDRDAIRLRIVLDPKDGESLYRALPPGVRLTVI